MKKILTTAFIIALSFGAAQAQSEAKKQQGQHHKGGHDKGMEKLNLSVDQKTKIQAINESYRKQMTELKNQTNITVADAKARREALHKQRQADIQAVLTAEQKAQFESGRKDWKKKEQKGDFNKGETVKSETTTMDKKGEWKGKRGGKDRKENMHKMQQELNLSADQQAKMAKLNQDFKAKSQSIRSNTSLSQDQKREQFKAAAQAHRDQVKSILTKEQIEKLQAAKGKRAVKNTK